MDCVQCLSENDSAEFLRGVRGIFYTARVWNWNKCVRERVSEETMRSTSSSLIFHSQERISTRNKKLSVRLSESITLFSFLSHLSDLFVPFLSSSCLVSFFLIQIAQLPSFWAILRTHLRLCCSIMTKERERSRPDATGEEWEKIMIVTFHCLLTHHKKASQSLLSLF